MTRYSIQIASGIAARLFRHTCDYSASSKVRGMAYSRQMAGICCLDGTAVASPTSFHDRRFDYWVRACLDGKIAPCQPVAGILGPLSCAAQPLSFWDGVGNGDDGVGGVGIRGGERREEEEEEGV